LLELVVVEAVAIGLLGVLVAGLLRSHAEILRRLHQLGAGNHVDGAGRDVDGAGRDVDGAGAPMTRAAPGAPLVTLAGVTAGGETVSLALDRPGERTLLLFLSSGCGTCAAWWEGLRDGAHGRALPGIRVIVVARDASEESPSLLSGLAPPDVAVVLSNATWDHFSVPGSPYAVLVDGSEGRVVGEGVARSWAKLGSLVGQHLGDIDRDGEARADAALKAAGIHPGHPSLHPSPGSLTRPS